MGSCKPAEVVKQIELVGQVARVQIEFGRRVLRSEQTNSQGQIHGVMSGHAELPSDQVIGVATPVQTTRRNPKIPSMVPVRDAPGGSIVLVVVRKEGSGPDRGSSSNEKTTKNRPYIFRARDAEVKASAQFV